MWDDCVLTLVESDPVDGFYLDESEAEDAAESLNAEHYRENAHGYPWAHGYAFPIESWMIDAAKAAGFVVGHHNATGQDYIGIDGGGYSFAVHWVRLALALYGDRGVPTDYGETVWVKGYGGVK